MKVIVFGGTGMLGSMVAKYLAIQGMDVTFTTRNRTPAWFPLKKKSLSVLRYDASEPIPDLTEYDWAINCIGAIKQKNVPASTMYAVNAVFPWKLAAACNVAQTKLIHISSDCVFSGNTPGAYRTGDPSDAKDDYGKSKALGEPQDAIVLRTSIIGPAEEKYGLFEWLFDSKTSVPGYTNHKWSGVTTLYLACHIESIITEHPGKAPGVYQIATNPVTKCQLLEMISDTFKLDVKINPVEAPEAINRTLTPSNGFAQPIHGQLFVMRDWLDFHG